MNERSLKLTHEEIDLIIESLDSNYMSKIRISNDLKDKEVQKVVEKLASKYSTLKAQIINGDKDV